MADRDDRNKNEAKAPPAPSAKEVADAVIERVAPELKKLAPPEKGTSWWKWLIGGAAVLAVVDQGKLAKTFTSFVGMLKAMFGFWGKSALKQADAALAWGKKWLRAAFWASVTVGSIALAGLLVGNDVESPVLVFSSGGLLLAIATLWLMKLGALANILAAAFEEGLNALGFFGRFIAHNLERRGVAVPTRDATPAQRLAFRTEVYGVVKASFIIPPVLGIFVVLDGLAPSWRTFGIMMVLATVAFVIFLHNIYLGKKVKLGLEISVRLLWALFAFLVLSIFLSRSAGMIGARGVDEAIAAWLADPHLGSRGLLVVLVAPALVLWTMMAMTSPFVILTPDRPVDLKRRRKVMAIVASVAAVILVPFCFWTGDITLKGLKEGEKIEDKVAEAQAGATGKPVPTAPGATTKQEPSTAPATTGPAADLPPPSMGTTSAPAAPTSSLAAPASPRGVDWSPGSLGWLIILLVVLIAVWLPAIGSKGAWGSRLRFIAGVTSIAAFVAFFLLIGRGSITWSGLMGKTAEASASTGQAYPEGRSSVPGRAAYPGPTADLPPPSRSGYVPPSADLPPPRMADPVASDHQPSQGIPAKRYSSFDEALADLQRD